MPRVARKTLCKRRFGAVSYVDIHAHFADEGYSFPEEWDKIRAAGVNTVVLVGDNVAHSKAHRDFCADHEGAYFCCGVHPSETDDFSDRTIEELRALSSDNKCVAVGEIGLDYHYPDTDKKKQREAFIKQILLAEEVGLPVQVHARDCAADALALLREMNAHMKRGFLLHCYGFGAEMMDDFLSLGAYFSFGGVTCFKNARKVLESAVRCPLDRILTETDSPYLSPFRGEKNTPANIPVIAQKIAFERGMDEDAFVAAVYGNAKRLFEKIK